MTTKDIAIELLTPTFDKGLVIIMVGNVFDYLVPGTDLITASDLDDIFTATFKGLLLIYTILVIWREITGKRKPKQPESDSSVVLKGTDLRPNPSKRFILNKPHDISIENRQALESKGKEFVDRMPIVKTINKLFTS